MLLEKAFQQLYPEKSMNYQTKITYSNRFSDYNANMKLSSTTLQASLSKKWRGVNQDIVIGLLQSLMTKIFKDKKESINIDLYNLFIKNLHIAAPKTSINQELKQSFDKINSLFFNSQMEMPNLIWGQFSRRKLGSYDFQTDTITMSKVFQHTNIELLEYVLYHEMLHKHFKFQKKACNNSFHSKEFKQAEANFPNAILLEKRLKFLPRSPKKTSFLTNIFFLGRNI